MTELLIGCGNRREKIIGEGDWTSLVTVDLDPSVKPDVVWDLNRVPLPFDPDTFSEIHCYDVLEHTGSQGDWRFFFRQWDDFWRILKSGGTFNCIVPKAESVWAWGDPGHTRVIHPASLTYLHRPAYSQIGETAMTDYRPYFVSDWDLLASGSTSEHQNGFILKAVKPRRD